MQLIFRADSLAKNTYVRVRKLITRDFSLSTTVTNLTNRKLRCSIGACNDAESVGATSEALLPKVKRL